jgi:hypothetical protein
VSDGNLVLSGISSAVGPTADIYWFPNGTPPSPSENYGSAVQGGPLWQGPGYVVGDWVPAAVPEPTTMVSGLSVLGFVLVPLVARFRRSSVTHIGK